MKILFIGDIVARPGRGAVASLLPGIVREHAIDFTIANCDNAAGGLGITRKTAGELLGLGIDVLTGGDHVWDRQDARSYLDETDRLLRAANAAPGVPGVGHGVYAATAGVRVAVVHLQGRVFMNSSDCPFRTGAALVEEMLERTPVVVVDVHAEATSEKVAMGRHLAGRATAVLGTHTHVQTADERIIEGHTAYITDVGMTGPLDSVIGMRTEVALSRFLYQLPRRYEAASGPAALSAVVLDVDETTGAARSIERLSRTGAAR